MKTLAVVFTVLLLAAARSVHALLEVSIPLQALYAEADTVAVVEVVEGRVVASGGETCGARYKGRVIEGTKGAAAGAVLDFGYLPSLKVGAAYLILLGKFESTELPRLPDFQTRCKSVLPTSAILANWRGVLELEGDTSNSATRASWTVRLPNYAIVPLGTRSTIVNGEKRYWFSDLIGRMSGEK